MNVSLGRKFEKIVAQKLKDKGHTLIHSNFFTPYGEIDLISEYKNKVIFTEVKYLQSSTIINPIFKVDLSKVRKIFLSILYLKKFCNFKEYRIDSVVVYKYKNKLKFSYFEELRLW
jgi:putative endonuclease